MIQQIWKKRKISKGSYASTLVIEKVTYIENFLTYKQYNYFGINNEKRLLNLVNSINHNGYPYLNKHIILFNDEDIIRDGQHRAAILAHLYGIDHKVKVMRFIFSDRDNNINIVKNNFKKATLWFAKKLYRKLKQYI